MFFKENSSLFFLFFSVYALYCSTFVHHGLLSLGNGAHYGTPSGQIWDNTIGNNCHHSSSGKMWLVATQPRRRGEGDR
jgi:hypothetical protein